ncbi:G2/M phase-specific E3 ubiquitin-protein ligase-like [Mercenaria mercenaria]|uniref:G2/M phase-specific E3 ubiquitin-protein ligase-like n=1 Tax=Mercenaria mercenaria TaxID=6596 RepID=UPI00234F3957|nr:G2/M phase-specific E3 ubiquitin-protein ligase-like [Mercenaria mercenaria]
MSGSINNHSIEPDADTVEDQSSNQTNDVMSAEEYFEQDDIQLAIEESFLSICNSNKEEKDSLLLKKWVDKALQPSEPQIIVVQRERLLQTTLRVVGKSTFNWSQPLRIVFSGEDGDDQGGPKREYLWLLSKAVAEASLCGPEGNMIFAHDGEKLEHMTFEMYGKLTAYNVLNGGPGLPMISTMLYSFMTDQDIKPHVDILMPSQTEEISCIKEVCNLFHAEITQFVNGLDKVGSLHKEILHAPEAFSSLFVHQAVHLKFDTFRLLYEVNFSPEGSNNRRLEKDTVYCLEAFLIECDGKENDIALADVLMFWTGTSSVPPMGFDKKLEVDFVTADRKLPVAHTCGMVLELVRALADPDLFKEDMGKAIKWSGGFHLC